MVAILISVRIVVCKAQEDKAMKAYKNQTKLGSTTIETNFVSDHLRFRESKIISSDFTSINCNFTKTNCNRRKILKLKKYTI